MLTTPQGVATRYRCRENDVAEGEGKLLVIKSVMAKTMARFVI